MKDSGHRYILQATKLYVPFFELRHNGCVEDTVLLSDVTIWQMIRG